MYEDYENLNYLAHHGILGMKWGKQNGPPYPLSEAKHEKVIARAEKKKIRQEKHEEYVQAKKAKKADNRRKAILKDPKKIVKFQDEFTKEEIETALDKMNTIDKVKNKIPESNLKQKIKKVNLSRKKKKWASTPSDLEKNQHKFTNEEMQEALQYLKNTETIYGLKIQRARRPLEATNTVRDYLNSISSIFGNWNALRDNTVKLTGVGMTNDERHKIWLKDNVSNEYLELLLNKGKKKKK